MIIKTKRETLKQLIKKLDKVFSIYIRQRDSDRFSGYGYCITCGKLQHWKDAQCGHYVKRQHMATRWDETNCGFQCAGCNCFEQGEPAKHKAYIDKKYGAGTSDQLELRKHNKVKLFDFFLKAEIERYKKLIKE